MSIELIVLKDCNDYLVQYVHFLLLTLLTKLT